VPPAAPPGGGGSLRLRIIFLLLLLAALGLGGQLPPGLGGPMPPQAKGRGRTRDQTGGGSGGGEAAASHLLTWFNDPPLHTLGSSDGWEDQNAPPGTPAGSPGLLVYFYPRLSPACGVRAKGSTLDAIEFRSGTGSNGSHYVGWTALDANGQYQVKGATDFEWAVLAAVNPGAAHLFTNPVSLGNAPSADWQDYDISTHVQGADECLAALLLFIGPNAARQVRVRKKGWTITDSGAIYGGGFAVVPVDGDNTFQAYVSNASDDVEMLLLGYVRLGITVPEAPVAETLSANNTLTDLSALPSGAEGAMYWWGRNNNNNNATIIVRPKGATSDAFATAYRGQGANSFAPVVRGGTDNLVEALSSTTLTTGLRFATIDAPPE